MDQIKPSEIVLDGLGVLTDTLGKAEHEAMAALIVRWHHVLGHKEWAPISRAALGELLTDDAMAKEWARNPFWCPSPYDFQQAGFIAGWTGDPVSLGTLTDKFHAGILKMRQRKR